MSTESRSRENLPPTSLIICSRNRPELLVDTVESMFQGEHVPTELVIIDQSDVAHPTLATLISQRGCTIRYKWSHTVGASRARNEGIACAQYDILALTDDDMLATPTWFGALIDALLAGGSKAVVTGQVWSTEVEVAGGFAPSVNYNKQLCVYQGRLDKDVLYTNNMALSRAAIDEVGNFDERLGPGTPFPAAEDNDLCFRLLEAGHRILFVPGAILYHRAWRSPEAYLPLRWNYGRGQGAYYAKYLSLRDRHMLRRLVVGIKNHCVNFLHRVRRQRREAYGEALYALGLFYGATQWLLTQRGRPRD